MTESKNICVRLKSGEIQEITLDISTGLPWRLEIKGIQLDDNVFTGSDTFEALVNLRKSLESLGCQILCAGARPDVTPSSMSRAAGGRHAYIIRLGASSLLSDLIDIFDYAAPEFVGTVEQQIAAIYAREEIRKITGSTKLAPHLTD